MLKKEGVAIAAPFLWPAFIVDGGLGSGTCPLNFVIPDLIRDPSALAA